LRFLEINTIIPAKSRLAVIKILSQIVLADLISPSLEVPDAPELRAIPFHLVGEGALGPAEGFGDGTVRDLVIVLPHGDHGICIGVKLPQAGKKAIKQVAVCNDALNGWSVRRNHVQKSVLSVLTDGDIQRNQVSKTPMLANEAVAVTDPDLTLRAEAVSVGLLPHTDAGCFAIAGIADFPRNRDFFTGGAYVDERLILVIDLHKIVSFGCGIRRSRFFRRTEKAAVDIVLP
jgi:hypothetical protein